ncbi:DUF559 domain-containing protein [Mesorhizobium sp.]|uniref:DUF559 domain-containing protein n=1 Tax=Mesorhizobium sp. TaxID=1871066 RepID=UPI0034417CE5
MPAAKNLRRAKARGSRPKTWSNASGSIGRSASRCVRRRLLLAPLPHSRHITKKQSILLGTENRPNRERDAIISAALQCEGWTVLRFWEHQVDAAPDAVVDKIMAAMAAALRRQTRQI